MSALSSHYSPENIVLKGGGAKGAEEVFAYQAMEEQGLLDPKQVKRYAGTSAGSIVGCLFAFGMTSQAALKLTSETHFESFMDGKSMKWLLARSKEGLKWYKAIPDAIHAKQAYNHLMKDQGLCSGDFFRSWIDARIHELVKGTELEQKQHITFADLHRLVETQPVLGQHFADLYVIGSNVNRQKTETFSYESTPNMCIADAIRISMSIPFVYKPWHRFDVNEQGVRHQVNDDVYVDGGLHEKDNFPMDLFDHEGQPNPKTLGFCLMSSNDYADHELHGGETHRKIQSAGDFFGATISMLEESKGSDRAPGASQTLDPRAIKLSTDTVGTLDFALTKEQLALLKAHAQIGVQEFSERLKAASMPEQLSVYEAKVDPYKAKMQQDMQALTERNKQLELEIQALRQAQQLGVVAKSMKTSLDQMAQPSVTSDAVVRARAFSGQSLFGCALQARAQAKDSQRPLPEALSLSA